MVVKVKNSFLLAAFVLLTLRVLSPASASSKFARRGALANSTRLGQPR
jgi:hypothetical protein